MYLFLFNFFHLSSRAQTRDYQVVSFWKLQRYYYTVQYYAGYYPQQPLTPTGSKEVMSFFQQEKN